MGAIGNLLYLDFRFWTPVDFLEFNKQKKQNLIMLPLSGVRILTIEQYGAAPYCSMCLANMGAEVIKIQNYFFMHFMISKKSFNHSISYYVDFQDITDLHLQ